MDRALSTAQGPHGGDAGMLTYADYLAAALTVAVVCAVLYFVLFVV